MSKKLKVAVVMRGGWSLGAFTGGAVWELVRQLHANRDRDVYERCEIDVLVGGGAGALTLALLLRTLANPEGFRPAQAIARVGEAQRAAWLEGMDFARLMRDVRMRRPALLDRKAVDELVTELITWPEEQEAHPVLLADRVLFGVSLLNFNGVPIRASSLPVLPATVSSTLFQDHRVFCFDFRAPASAALTHWRRFAGARARSPDTWQEVAATAVASGAFPIAFEPVVLQRYREEYGSLWPAELQDRAEFPFTFGDGGPFQHEPLREAMRLIAQQDAPEPADSFERVLIFIDPNLSGSKHAFGLKFHLPYMVNSERAWTAGDDVVPTDPSAHLVAITNRYGVLARHQTIADDLIAAARVNARAGWRNELRPLITELAKRLACADAEAAGDLAQQAQQQLETMLQRERALAAAPGAPPPDVSAAIDRVAREQKRAEPSETDSAQRLAHTLLALVDQVADLREREAVRLLLVAPTEFQPTDGSNTVNVRLAGDFFANFGGFFDARYRVHDFDAGRALAAGALARDALLAEPAERPGYKPWADRAPSLEAVPAARDRFVRRIAELTRQLLEYKIGYLGVTQAIAIVAHYVTPRLVRDSGPGRRSAIVRIEIAGTDPHAEFHLAVASKAERGGDARRIDDLVVLHTVLHYSDTDVVGPHVLTHQGSGFVRVAERRRSGRDRHLDVPLPNVTVLQANADFGLPIHRIRIDWTTRTTSAWTQYDALLEWPAAYPPTGATRFSV